MKTFEASIGSESVLVCQFGPSIQIQSALDPVSKKYFLKVFKSKKPKIEEFAHSYVPADTSSQSMGARMVVYKDGKIVIGKAPNHAYLEYQPISNGPRMEGYYSTNKKTITFSGEENGKSSQGFSKLSWKTIFSRLKISGLVDDTWKVHGCPPMCGEKEITVEEIISGNWDPNSEGETLKSKEAEALVRNFMLKKAIQGKNSDIMSYMYRYADNVNNNIRTFSEWLKYRI